MFKSFHLMPLALWAVLATPHAPRADEILVSRAGENRAYREPDKRLPVEIKAGDTLVALQDIPLGRGTAVVGQVAKGSTLRVTGLRGEFVGLAITVEGREQVAWLEKQRATARNGSFVLVSATAACPSPPSIVFPKPAERPAEPIRPAPLTPPEPIVPVSATYRLLIPGDDRPLAGPRHSSSTPWPTASAAQSPEVCLDRGNRCFAQGDLDQAIAEYSAALRLNAQYALAYNNRGRAWEAKGDHDRAIADLDQALLLDPDYAFAYNNRGVAWMAKGDYDKAIADYTKAVLADPRYALAYANRGQARRVQGDVAGALEDYAEALRVDPRCALAFRNRGLTWRLKGDYTKAIADLSHALQLGGDPASLYFERGLAYGESGDLEAAIRDFSEAIRIQPAVAEGYNSRGWGYWRKGDAVRAIQDFTEAIRLRPQFAGAYNNRGVVYWKTGALERAIEDFTVALCIDPQFVKAQNNRAAAIQAREALSAAGSDGCSDRPLSPGSAVPVARPLPPSVYGSSIIMFENQSGAPAVVRLVGPTRGEVFVPNGGRSSIQRVAAGSYVIYMRYGAPGEYRYTAGDRFEVQDSGPAYSSITITLHTVPSGNYRSRASSEGEFCQAAR